MNWFFIALINPISHAVVNHLNKYILSRYMKGESVGALVLLTSLFSFFALPVILLLNPGALSGVSLLTALALMLNGCFLLLAIICYLYALSVDEASFVAPLFQLIPVFGFGLGYFVLGETLATRQLLAASLIVLGAVALSLEISGRRSKIKTKLLLFMTGSSIFYALNGVIFKYLALDEKFLDSLFWNMAGAFVLGVILFLTVSSYRRELASVIKVNSWKIITLAFVGEALALAGEAALVLAVLFAPVALVQAVGGLQPLFVFIIGLILTFFMPQFGKESMETKTLIQKITGIGIVTAGVYFLSF